MLKYGTDDETVANHEFLISEGVENLYDLLLGTGDMNASNARIIPARQIMEFCPHYAVDGNTDYVACVPINTVDRESGRDATCVTVAHDRLPTPTLCDRIYGPDVPSTIDMCGDYQCVETMTENDCLPSLLPNDAMVCRAPLVVKEWGASAVVKKKGFVFVPGSL